MFKNFNLIWFVLSILSLVACFIAFDAYAQQKYFGCIIFFLIAISLQIACWSKFSKKMNDAEKIITSIQNKDFTLFPETDSKNDLKANAVKLYYQAKNEHKDLFSFKNLYESILNKMEIGFLILNKTQNEESWKVFYCNPSFTNILKVPKYNEWNFYKDKSPDFFQLIENTNFADSQEFIDISIQESTSQSYSIRTSRISNFGNDFCVISLESIQRIIDKKEKQAWNNLMKVISHELLNTLTPVNSLIYNLEYLTAQEELTQEDQEEIKDSLKIITSKSQQLLHFIDSYRQIAELPKPKKEKINLKNTIEKAIKIFETEFKQNNIHLEISAQDYFILADETMIERVLINLLTNAQLALKTQDSKNISIQVSEVNNRILLSVEDNGVGIDPQIESKIFLPFFTTRQNGSGIGLTLSKGIMEAHNGYLIYRRLEKGSAFEMWFV
ncbi:ATP-binding protein [Soonwooa sp.]|uniref:sensor histidine kinase n=1 Tax=Soonwooa sp. TaxID=1938592 RepID=UPI00263001D4|nr:ATP-binding protein [Soonwooa sp.]